MSGRRFTSWRTLWELWVLGCSILGLFSAFLKSERGAEQWNHLPQHIRSNKFGMSAQKFNVHVVIRGETRACPLDWLRQFCLRNFTNSPDFDDPLPAAAGQVETSFRPTPERFAESLPACLTHPGKGEGHPLAVSVLL